MKKSKKGLVLFIVLIVLVVCDLFYFNFIKEKKMSDFYPDDISKIQSIQITNGNNGNTIDITKDTDINMLTDYLKTLNVQKKSFGQSTGWRYAYKINYDDTTLEIVFAGQKCTINNVQYKLTGTNENLDNIYNTLDNIYNTLK